MPHAPTQRRAGRARLLLPGLLCLIALLPPPAAPADAPAEGARPRLAEVVEGTLAAAGQLVRTDALRSEAAAVRQQAGAFTAADPGLRLKGVTDQFNADAGAYELEALVELPLWLPGQRRARLELARALGVRADALAGLLRWEVTGAVRDAVWEVALAKVQADQARTAYAAAEALQAVVAKRYAAGELARLDLLTAEQETLARAAELTTADAALARAEAAYATLTGRTELPLPPEPGGNAATADAPAPLLPEHHPLLVAANAALGRARAERDRVASERRGHPILSLGGVRVRDDPRLDGDNAVQVEVSIPFGLRSHAAPALAASEREVTDQLAELHRLRRAAEGELVEAVLGRRGAAAALAVAEARARLAADALAVAERGFALGETDLSERLLAERRAREAQLDLALRRAEQGQALARVNQALGILPE
jgi:outer membrane protein, heavy metal efflux system